MTVAGEVPQDLQAEYRVPDMNEFRLPVSNLEFPCPQSGGFTGQGVHLRSASVNDADSKGAQIPDMHTFRLDAKSLDHLPQQLVLPRSQTASRVPSRVLSERSPSTNDVSNARGVQTPIMPQSMSDFKIPIDILEPVSPETSLPRGQGPQVPRVGSQKNNGSLSSFAPAASCPSMTSLAQFSNAETARTGCSEKSRVTAMREADIDLALQRISQDRTGTGSTALAEGEEHDSHSSCSTDRDDDFGDNQASTWRDETPLGESLSLMGDPQTSNFSNETTCNDGRSPQQGQVQQDVVLAEGCDAPSPSRLAGTSRLKAQSCPKLDSIQDEDAADDISDAGSLFANRGCPLSPKGEEIDAKQTFVKSASQESPGCNRLLPQRRSFLRHLLPKVAAKPSAIVPSEFSPKERTAARSIMQLFHRATRRHQIDSSAAGG